MAINTKGKIYAISHAPESSYGTAVAAATGVNKAHQQIVGLRADAPVDIDVRTKDNLDFATGSNFANRNYTTEHDSRKSFTVELDSYFLAWALKAVLGSMVSSAPYAGASTVKKHRAVPYDPKVTTQLGSYTLLEYLAANQDRVFPGMVAESLEIKGEGATTIQSTMAMIGSGKVIKPSTHNVDWADTANVTVVKANGRKFFENPQAQITIADAATLSNADVIGCRIRNWSWMFQNQLLAELGYMPNCQNYQDSTKPENGIVRSRLLSSGQSIMPKVTLELGSVDMLQDLIDQKPLDFVTTLNTNSLIATGTGPVDYFHSATLHAYLTKYKAVKRSTPDDFLVVDIEPNVLQDDNGNVFEAIVLNTTATY